MNLNWNFQRGGGRVLKLLLSTVYSQVMLYVFKEKKWKRKFKEKGKIFSIFRNGILFVTKSDI